MFSHTAHFLKDRDIIVVGAGIAGLSFAIALRKYGSNGATVPRLTVLDRDPREPDVKRQGYSLALNGIDEDGGLAALQQLGLLDRVLEYATTSTLGMPFKMWDGAWNELISVSSTPWSSLPVGMLRVPRVRLRQILIEEAERLGVDIKWASQFRGVTRLNNGRLSAIFSSNNLNTSECVCDILIAADGAHSSIRASIRPDDQLQSAGATQIGGIATFSNGLPSPLNEGWGILVSGYGNSCFCTPIQDNAVVWALSKIQEVSNNTPAQITERKRQEILTEAREHCEEIAEPFASLLDATDLSTVFEIPARDKQPFDHVNVMPGVIFIGDSNHAVSPFAGNGANLALQDGLNLAELLLSSNSLETAVNTYDKRAMPRAIKTLKSSHWRITIAHLTGIRFAIFRRFVMMGGFFLSLKEQILRGR
ncbi:hypothetical protein Asppvi_001996 [Aspergillus pseudoviridinutans]|uniref:FAD-binding domain-containing protein n=1 Tax=Aspergillus pseudoviridinutans TaxID=1517512 RepID=A0A9P3BQL7_9EURO|nr:uncharacterized protein Asppvi_001996 [Aspergillus pseudoviridinutans]GIJ92718.1 hypothetical protein Asppvi_001996 [Aspergillus pseudoviridinutans]